MSTLIWKNEDPNLVKGLILSADTELANYWLQVYQVGSLFHSGFYGITADGRYGLMGMELHKTIETAMAHSEAQWESFRANSRLYPNAKRRGKDE